MTAVSGEKTVLKSKVKIGRVRWSILAMLFVVTTVNYADRSTLSIAGDAIQKSLGINAVTMGYLFSAFGWTYLISQIPSGYLLDRFGAKKVYSYAIVLWSAFTMAQGAIGNFSAATAVGLLFLLRLLVGLFEGPSFPGNSKIVAAWFPTKERGFAAAIFNSAQYFATVVFTPLMGWLVVSMGWEHVFTVIGGIGVVLGFVWLVVIYSPARHPRLRQPELEYITAGGAVLDMDKPTRAVKAPKGLTGRSIKALLTNRMLLGVYVGQYFINTITWFFLTWFPVYLVQDRGMSILKAGFVAVLPALCGFIGGILGGFVSDRLLRHGVSLTWARKIPIVTGLLLSSSILICNWVDSEWLIVAIMALSFFGKGLGALGWAVVADTAPKQVSGLSGGVFNTFGSLAAITTPIIIGYLISVAGNFSLALIFVGASAVAAVLSYLVIVGPIRRLDFAYLDTNGDTRGTATEQPA
jgi:ACS family glucarate transporter-like MFS transporter